MPTSAKNSVLRVIRKGFNYSQDGPGNRLVIHLQGCNYRCKWCSNPESFPAGGLLMVDESRTMEEYCPYGAIGRDGTINRKDCALCEGKPCLDKYRNRAIQWSCREERVIDLIEEAVARKGLFYAGGGVTLTGGEPTMQFQSVKHFLSGLKQKKIHTAMESNACHPKLSELFNLIDVLMLDLKHVNSGKHKEWTGSPVETSLSQIRLAAEKHPNLWIRIPLIPDFNDSEAEITEMAEFISSLNWTAPHVEILEYHNFGAEKWKKAGMDYLLSGMSLSVNKISLARRVFESFGIRLQKT